MSERDTHFAGYAELFYPELARLFYALHTYRILREYEKADLVEHEIKEYLAQRAYDLLYTSFEFTRTSPDPRTMQLSSTEVWMRFIPDITTWPGTVREKRQ